MVDFQSEGFDGIRQQWLRSLIQQLGAGYGLNHSAHFVVVTGPSYAKRVRWLCDTAEKILARVHSLLGGLGENLLRANHVIVVFDSFEAYKRHVESFAPDSAAENVSSSGVLIQPQVQPVHIALPLQDLSVTEGLLAHELTRLAIVSLDAPIWLEEGFACNIEHELTGFPPLLIDEVSVKRLREFWDTKKIQQFWSGESFYHIDERAEHSRSLAQLLVHALVRQYESSVVRRFVLMAQKKDSGEQSAAENLNVSLGDVLVAVLRIQKQP